MNAPDLEKHLAALAPRRLPETWKAGILQSAASVRVPAFFRIERLAWSAIAATWLAILALRTTTPFIAPPSGPPVSARDVAEHWRQIRLYSALDLVPDESTPPARIHIEQEFILHARPRS